MQGREGKQLALARRSLKAMRSPERKGTVPSQATCTPSNLIRMSPGCSTPAAREHGCTVRTRTPFWPGAMPQAARSAPDSMRCHWMPRAGKPVKVALRRKSSRKCCIGSSGVRGAGGGVGSRRQRGGRARAETGRQGRAGVRRAAMMGSRL